MMKLISVDSLNQKAVLSVDLAFLRVIKLAIDIVISEITYAFHPRMGYYPEEVIIFGQKISEILISKKSGLTIIDLSFEELVMINECLNEICNGLKINDFETRIGFDKDTVRSWLKKINSIICDYNMV